MTIVSKVIKWDMDYNFGEETFSIRNLEGIENTAVMLEDEPVGYVEEFGKDFEKEIIVLKLNIGSTIEPFSVDQLEFNPVISKQDNIHKTELVGVKAVPKDYGVEISKPDERT